MKCYAIKRGDLKGSYNYGMFASLEAAKEQLEKYEKNSNYSYYIQYVEIDQQGELLRVLKNYSRYELIAA